MSQGNVHARRRWAYRMLARCAEPPPTYGSAEWLALPEGSVEKVAAVVRAAEAWAIDADNIEERLRLELDLEREAFKQAEDADYTARRDAHRAEWGRLRLVKGEGFSQTKEFRERGTTRIGGESA